jgi:hypothetical protein
MSDAGCSWSLRLHHRLFKKHPTIQLDAFETAMGNPVNMQVDYIRVYQSEVVGAVGFVQADRDALPVDRDRHQPIELRRDMEAVAAARGELPPGGAVPAGLRLSGGRARMRSP